MAAVHLADAVGGNVFLGFISAVAFATILAVVAGLTLSGASAVSHDLYATVVKKGKADSASELRVSRITTICLGIVAVVLGIAFQKQNIAFMVSLAFAVAASANFPVLFMSVLWKDCTTKGAVVGGFLGLISSVLLTVLSPSVWEATLGNPVGSAPFPYTSPAIFSMPLAFLAIWLVSKMDNSARAKIDRAGFLAQQVRSETGIGASEASATEREGGSCPRRIRPPIQHGPPPTGRADPASRERREFISLMTSRVRDAPLRKPFYVDGATDLVTLCRAALRARPHRGAGARRRPARHLHHHRPARRAAPRRPARSGSPVRDVAIFEPLSVQADDELFEALILMLRHGFHRVIVREGEAIVGVLDPARPDGLRRQPLAAHRARGRAGDDRRRARRRGAARSRALIRVLSEDGVRVEIIAGLVGGLNRRIFQRLWTLIAPDALRANSCLLVMGSEGRGEQIISTDQDNGLILRDGFACPELEARDARLHRRADRLRLSPLPRRHHGQPPALAPAARGLPRASLRDWTQGSDPEGPMNLAIFLDAAVVSGDAGAPRRRARATSGGCSPAATPSTPASPPPSSSSAATAAGGGACPACAGARRPRST